MAPGVSSEAASKSHPNPRIASQGDVRLEPDSPLLREDLLLSG
jgi:hypothetical protein